MPAAGASIAGRCLPCAPLPPSNCIHSASLWSLSLSLSCAARAAPCRPAAGACAGAPPPRRAPRCSKQDIKGLTSLCAALQTFSRRLRSAACPRLPHTSPQGTLSPASPPDQARPWSVRRLAYLWKMVPSMMPRTSSLSSSRPWGVSFPDQGGPRGRARGWAQAEQSNARRSAAAGLPC